MFQLEGPQFIYVLVEWNARCLHTARAARAWRKENGKVLGPRTEVFGNSTIVLRGILPVLYFHCHPKGDLTLAGCHFSARVGTTANFLGTCKNAQSFVRSDIFAGTLGLPAEHRRACLEGDVFISCGTQESTPPDS